MKRKIRTERLSVRMTKDEHKKVEHNARNAGYTKSYNGKKVANIAEYTRDRILVDKH